MQLFCYFSDCEFGDTQPWACTSLRDDSCYDNSVEQKCCKTCDDRAKQRQPKIEGKILIETHENNATDLIEI